MSPAGSRNPFLPHDEARVLDALRVARRAGAPGSSGEEVAGVLRTDRVYVDAILLGLAMQGRVHVTAAGRWSAGPPRGLDAEIRTRLAYSMCTVDELAASAGRPAAAMRDWLAEHRWISGCRVGDRTYWHGPLTAVHVMHYMRQLGPSSSADVAGAFGLTQAVATEMLQSLCARTEYAPVRVAPTIRAS